MNTIITTDPAHPHWSATLAHLERHGLTRHALRDGQPKPDTTYLGALCADSVVGHIAIKRQPLVVPASPFTGSVPQPLTDAHGRPLYEAFVQTFAVDEALRRQGIGRALQHAALATAREQGCVQLRSWSSADRPANYALKVSMGFAVVPALYPMPGGDPISGVYFVWRFSPSD